MLIGWRHLLRCWLAVLPSFPLAFRPSCFTQCLPGYRPTPPFPPPLFFFVISVLFLFFLVFFCSFLNILVFLPCRQFGVLHTLRPRILRSALLDQIPCDRKVYLCLVVSLTTELVSL